ncbi:membrane-spanning 4-domains subfamily A member 12-like [Tamandua tetradactyla]|uniref:membrane-spanning 4-domains subfamily A member 12-like n=1 Tax=Tamandua tetradactyla TaxID=48850 RepID=UPI0040541B88
MEESGVYIREETRMLGAIQIMVGVLHHSLAVIWTSLLITQIIAFQNDYLPLTVLTGYPYWSAVFFITSGICAIILERNPGKNLVTYTVVMSIISACIASIGVLIMLLEFLSYYIKREKTVWPQRCGKILTNYLFLFTFLELTVASTVAHWGLKAKHSRT